MVSSQQILRLLSLIRSYRYILFLTSILGLTGLISTAGLVSMGCGGGGGGTTPGIESEAFVGDGGAVDPTDTNTSTSATTDSCVTSDTGSVSATSINFGLNEINSVTCQTVTVTPACVGFTAEVTSSSDTAMVETDEGLVTEPQFVFQDDAGNESGGRTTGEGYFNICYKRQVTGTYTGTVNVVITSGSQSYAYVISLTGQTMEALFRITSPNPDPKNLQLIYEGDGVSTVDSVNGIFTFTASGSLNPELKSIFTSNNVTIRSGGLSQTIPYGSDYSFSTVIQIPASPAAVYPVVFSIDTTQGTLTKTIDVIRYYKPVGALDVRDSSGNVVSTVAYDDETVVDPSLTDSTSLLAGLGLNLDVSGPRADHPDRISLTLTRPDNSQLKYDPNQEAGKHWVDMSASSSEILFYLDDYDFTDADDNEVVGERGLCDKNFGEGTYCFYLPPTAELGKGTNIITATICNNYTDDHFNTVDAEGSSEDVGCTEVSNSIIVDNDLPIITISTPTENGVYAEGNTITVTGTIENFAPTSTTVTTTDNDGTTITATSTTCDTLLWVNTAVDLTKNQPISLCDKLQVVKSTDWNNDNGNRGNTREATFSVELSVDGDGSGFNKLTLFTNMLYVQAKNASGHAAYAVRTFQRGKYETSNFTTTSGSSGKISLSSTGDLTTGQLGSVSNLDGSTQGTPIMLNISEGTLTDENVLAVIKKFMNDNLDFVTLAMGFGPKKDEDGNVIPPPIPEADPETEREKFIDELIVMLHGTSPEQVKAIWSYQHYLYNDDPTKFFSSNQAQDACGNPLTTAVVTPDIFQYLSPWISPTYLHEWPLGLCGNDLDCKDVTDAKVQGHWDIDLDLKDDGFIDANLVLAPKAEGEPAFFAYFTAYNLVEQGSTGAYKLPDFGIADPTIPLWMNFGKMTIHLKDVARIMKAKLKSDGTVDMCTNIETGEAEPCPCEYSTSCTNMLYVYQSRLERASDRLLETGSYNKADEKVLLNTVQFEPYREGCQYFHEKFPDAELPGGCDTAATRTQNTFLLDVNSDTGIYLWNNYQDALTDPTLQLFDLVFAHTLVNIIGCAGTQLINPIIDPVAFPYPSWTPEDSKVDLTMALDNAADGVTVTQKDDAENPVFYFTPNLKDADINIFDDGLTLKLPLSMGASGVSNSMMASLESIFGTLSSTTKRNNGFIYREPTQAGFEDTYPLHDVTTEPYLGASIGLEEFGNAALHLLFKKGLKDVLDLLSSGLSRKLKMLDNWTIGVDKVILGRFGDNGICGLNVLSTSLITLFEGMSDFISTDDLHLDISLDKNSPPTLVLLPVEGDETNSSILQVGLTNLQIDVKELIDDEDNKYHVGNSVAKVRGDIMLRLVLRYDRTTRRMEIYLLPLDQTPIYLTVVNRGLTYDDNSVITGIRDTVLPALWPTLSASYVPGADNNIPTFRLRLPESVNGLSNTVSVTTADEEAAAEEDPDAFVSANFMTASPAKECEPGTAPEYSHDKLSELSESFWSGIRETARNLISLLSSRDIHYSSPKSILSHIPTRTISFDPACTSSLSSFSDDPLCKLGIENVRFGESYPDLQFDYNNGYLHLSTELLVDVTDWLADEVSVE